VNSEELVRIHLALECVGVSADGQLVRIPGPEPDDIHRFFVVQHDRGCFAYARADLPLAVRKRLSAVPPEVALREVSLIQSILAEHAICESVTQGKAYVFSAAPSQTDYPDVVRLNREDSALVEPFDPGFAAFLEKRPVFAILFEGKVVAGCVSAREDQAAGEAWVQTAPDFRRRGYARQATAAWAHHLQQQGKIPFYSHLLDNLASEALAGSLGLVPYKVETAYR